MLVKYRLPDLGCVVIYGNMNGTNPVGWADVRKPNSLWWSRLLGFLLSAQPTKFSLRAILFVSLFVSLLAGCGGETVQPPNNGEPAPSFQTESLAGGQVRVPQDYLGKVVAIRFWADWCPYCRKEMAELQPVYARLQPRGLEVLAVNVAQDRATVSRFVSPLNITYPVLFDLEGATARAYGVQALPVTWFFDRNGNVRGKIVGETTPDVFERKVMELLVSSE